MPLLSGSSQDVISRNIRKLIREGKPREQAIAIALDNARKGKNAKKRAGKRKLTVKSPGKRKLTVKSPAQKRRLTVKSSGRKKRVYEKSTLVLPFKKAIAVTGPGPKDGHTHFYEDDRPGRTSTDNGHWHPVSITDNGVVIGPAVGDADGHTHAPR